MSLSDWPDIPAYKVFCKFVDSFPLTNDHTERAIKRTSDYINFGSKGEQDLQAILQAVESAIARVPNRKTRKALIAAYDPDEEEEEDDDDDNEEGEEEGEEEEVVEEEEPISR